MRLARQTIDRLVALCERPRRHGEWREFCEREGVAYDSLRYWRRKLSLRHRTYSKSVTLPVNSYSDIATV